MPNEIIVVDDCSTDHSVDFLLSAYPAIRILRNLKNSGFSVSVNKGVKQAQYDKVLILNSDVKLTPHYFKHQCEKYFEKENTFGFCVRRACDWRRVDNMEDASSVRAVSQCRSRYFGTQVSQPSLLTTNTRWCSFASSSARRAFAFAVSLGSSARRPVER